MSPLTLPGTIPGLLRRGSPVVENNRAAVYLGADKHGYHYVADLTPGMGCGHRIAHEPVYLDLSDPTGRAHAAWWALTTFDMLFGDMGRLRPDDARVLRLAATGKDMTDAEIAALRLVCLHVAGVSP
jgi:hypothetical protein